MATPQQFKNRRAAHTYLLDKGHGQPYRTFAAACKSGRCIVEADNKTIQLSSLTDYINAYLAPISTSGDDALARRKLIAETEAAENKNEKAKIANREANKAWMQRADHDQQVAAILGIAFDIVRRELALSVEKIMHITNCDHDRKPELIALLKETINISGNTLAATNEFDVVFGSDGEPA